MYAYCYWLFFMNLLEVKDLFSEIVDNCPTLEGVHFMIAPSIAQHSVVDGYEIHMSGKKIDDKTITYLRDLATRNGLFFDTRESMVAIFKVRKGVFA